MSEEGRVLPGQRLRAEREAQGISQEDVARRLNLTVTFVQALEADEYERLPEATFVRGYIRNYARELELPADELAEAFSEVMQAQEETPETVDRPQDLGGIKHAYRAAFSITAPPKEAANAHQSQGQGDDHGDGIEGRREGLGLMREIGRAHV
mgnify:CR=1 FL=1